ncbi:hypothetical protein [Guptibacillus spartinae]|uniref:hypothetical protein n=1 Tax=Guptibacillus spartinae TaxID=3025679 RepID=UPI0023614C18|nr:hypothetical protein [Pseudalkalibacillus spartinae]
MRKVILSNANTIAFIVISILLLLEVVDLVKEQSTWNLLFVIMLSISWLSFLLLLIVKPKHANEE